MIVAARGLPAGTQEDCPRGSLDKRFCDRNGDLVADAPADASKWVDPSTLIFAYTPDTVVVSQRSSGGSTGTFDFLLRGGPGADGLKLDVAGPASYTPAGAALLDGGPAVDRCNVVGSAVARKQGCEP